MKYFAVARKAFVVNIVYKLDLLGNIINAFVSIFISITIWNAIYSEDPTFDGFQFSIIFTYIILSLSIFNVFVMDDYWIEKKIRTGLIAIDLLKPVNFLVYVFYYNVGITLFRITIIMIPSILLFSLLYGILPPFSVGFFFLFTISTLLGYFVIFFINFIVWMAAFWVKRTFSLVIIKDVIILLFSGAVIPLWFMPKAITEIIKYTPLDSILYTPVLIYLGQIPVSEITAALLKQLVWILVLFLISISVLKLAEKKLDIQGG